LVCFALLEFYLNRKNSLFNLPEADKCLLALGELDVGSSMFDVQKVSALAVPPKL
jgi:hypothetical protein